MVLQDPWVCCVSLVSCAAGKEALLLSGKRIVTLEMLPSSSLWSVKELGCWLCGMDGVGSVLSAVLRGACL